MGSPQWSDLGMFLQTFMLLAKEAGLDTCAQEAWSLKNDSVSEFVNSDAGTYYFVECLLDLRMRVSQLIL